MSIGLVTPREGKEIPRGISPGSRAVVICTCLQGIYDRITR
jgi:hypothetical protein